MGTYFLLIECFEGFDKEAIQECLNDLEITVTADASDYVESIEDSLSEIRESIRSLQLTYSKEEWFEEGKTFKSECDARKAWIEARKELKDEL